MASGLTVIFSMLGVLNFAHASFYMLGAFFGFQISRWIGFWPALLIAPPLVGAHRSGRRTLRPSPCPQERPRRGTVLHVRSRLCHRGSGADHLGQKPGRLSVFRRCSIFLPSPFSRPITPPTRCSCCWCRRHLRWLADRLKKTRIGLIVQAALTHPHMVGHLGHNVGRIFMMVFGVGTALAAVAGVIAGPALVTQSNMAGAAWADPVRGRRRRRSRLAAGSIHRVVADRAGSNLCRVDERIAREHLSDRSDLATHSPFSPTSGT